jgi:hypothetical protein
MSILAQRHKNLNNRLKQKGQNISLDFLKPFCSILTLESWKIYVNFCIKNKRCRENIK